MSNVTELKTAEERRAEIDREALMESLRARAQYINGLRAFADALAADTDIPLPDYTDLSFYAVGENPRGELARAAKALPGKVDKSNEEGMYSLVARFGPIAYKLCSTRVCERRQVGTKTITREEPVETRTVTEEVPIYEWECPPLLGGDAAA